MSIEWISHRLRRAYKAGHHVDPFELDRPRLGETRPRRSAGLSDRDARLALRPLGNVTPLEKRASAAVTASPMTHEETTP